MNLNEFYKEMNSDYNEVLSRFGGSEAMVRKFVNRFLDDHSIEMLNEASDIETAFRAAHTIKGICLNLGFKSLFEPANALTEKLRPKQEVDYSDLLKEVNDEYKRIVNLIHSIE